MSRCGASSVKSLNYLLAGVIGAAIASLATYRICNLGPAPAEPAAAPVRVIVHPGPSPVELARLAQENVDLGAQLAGTQTKLAEHDAALAQTRQSLEELRRPMTTDMMSSALRAQLKSGEVVVTGGYRLSNGKRLYAFAQPVVQQADGKDVVKIQSRFLSVTDDAAKSVGLDSIATNAANTLQHGEVWVGDEQASVLAKLGVLSDTDLLTSPGVTVLPGSSGVIELGDLKLKMTPVVADDHTSMDFEVRLEQPQVPLAPPAPPKDGTTETPPDGGAPVP